jgi:hypothetical protein
MNVDNLELALGSIRVYASEHGLSGDQVRAMFSVGISPSLPENAYTGSRESLA